MDFRVRTAGTSQFSWKIIRHQFLFLWWRIGPTGRTKCHKMTRCQKLSVPSKKNVREGIFRISWNPSHQRNGFTDKNVILSHVGTGMIVQATWNQTEQSVKTENTSTMAHGPWHPPLCQGRHPKGRNIKSRQWQPRLTIARVGATWQLTRGAATMTTSRARVGATRQRQRWQGSWGGSNSVKATGLRKQKYGPWFFYLV